MTYTLNGNFGAGVVAPGTGFLLNNEMDDFTVKPGAPNLFGLVQGKANAIAPGKRPLSSMTPTMVERDGALCARARQSGRPADHHLGARDARPTSSISACRRPTRSRRRGFTSNGCPILLYYERGGFPPETLAALAERGYELKEQAPWGAVELIAIGPDGNRLGVSDPRRPAGAAVGY